MQIKTVSYGRTFNLGDFKSSRIDFSAELDDGDNENEAFEDLMDLVYAAHKKEMEIVKGEKRA